jgi:hypothetical protein
MNRSITFAVLTFISLSSAMGGESNSVNLNKPIESQAVQNKDNLIVAVTKPGNVAADTAWLLSNQAQVNHSYTPILLVLKPKNSVQTLKSLKLASSELPALVYMDSNGKVLNRVVNVASSSEDNQIRGIGATSLN